jgi:hypothetical protein
MPDLFVTVIIRNICYAIIAQYTWTVLLLLFLFNLLAAELCDILSTAGSHSFLFMAGPLLLR